MKTSYSAHFKRPYASMPGKAGLCHRQSGVSLVELMISMAIGLLITAAMISVFINLKQTYKQQEAFSRIQETARYAFDRMAYDIRLAGTTGCNATTTVNVLAGAATWYSTLFTRPMMSYEDGAAVYPSQISGKVLRGDAFAVIRADNSSNYIVDSHNPPSAQFQLTATHDLKQGEVLLVTDCKHAAVFQMTTPVNSDSTAQNIVHNTGERSPGNCTKNLGSPSDCVGTEYEFKKGSRVMRLKALTYYIRTSDATGQPSLYRQVLTHKSGDAYSKGEEIVEGIEDMQIEYGVDTTLTADNSVDTYVKADQVTTAAPGATDDEKWQRVISVRASLLVRSNEDNVATNYQKYKWNGGDVTATDKRLRKVFSMTMTLRDRIE